jgi:hypothetical protein
MAVGRNPVGHCFSKKILPDLSVLHVVRRIVQSFHPHSQMFCCKELDALAMDWNSAAGFANAIRYILRLKRGSFCMLAPVCSTWVFVSRGSTHRSHAYPMGNTGFSSVRDGNKMVSRVALAIYLLNAKQCFWILEQPMSSLLMLHIRMQQLMDSGASVYRAFVWLGAYGHTSPKPTYLYSSHDFVAELGGRALTPGQTFENQGIKAKLIALTPIPAPPPAVAGTAGTEFLGKALRARGVSAICGALSR